MGSFGMRRKKRILRSFPAPSCTPFTSVSRSEGYPPDLETLVKGVQLGAGNDRKIRFLRRIPKDPMTGQTEWRQRAVQDDPGSTSWGGKNVFDVYSKSTGTASDGTRYADW